MGNTREGGGPSPIGPFTIACTGGAGSASITISHKGTNCFSAQLTTQAPSADVGCQGGTPPDDYGLTGRVVATFSGKTGRIDAQGWNWREGTATGSYSGTVCWW